MGLALTDTRRLRVLWVTVGLGRGGTERLLVDTVTRLDPDRCSIEVAYVLPWKDALGDDLRRRGVPVTCVGGRRAPLDVRWALRLARLVRRGDWDIVHTHAPLPAVVVRLAARRRTVVVHTEHNSWPRYRPLTRLLNAVTFGRNRHVFAVSEHVAASISTRRRHGVEVLLQGLPAERPSNGTRAEALERLGVDGTRPVVGTVGNLVPKKDHATLVDAAARLTGEGVDIDVVIVGGGPLEAELREHVARTGANVRLLGSRDDVPALLPGFDVFVLPSRFEGLPIAMLEAMAAGVPVIASDVGGVPEVLAGGRGGIVVRAGDPDALADAIGALLGDDRLRAELAAAAVARVADFDLRRAIDRTEALYREVVTPC